MTVTRHGEMKYTAQLRGRSHYGHVRLRVSLGGPEQGVVFRNCLADGAIPERLIESVKSAVLSFAKGGALARHGYEFARIELIDGSYHETDSTPLAFFMATWMAFDQALRTLPPPPADEDDRDPGVRVPRPPQSPTPSLAAAVPEPDDPDRRFSR
jgi:elongation factor G